MLSALLLYRPRGMSVGGVSVGDLAPSEVSPTPAAVASGSAPSGSGNWITDMDRYLGIPTGPGPDGSPDPNEPPGGYFPSIPDVSWGSLGLIAVAGVGLVLGVSLLVALAPMLAARRA
jgi:hypothetical protein